MGHWFDYSPHRHFVMPAAERCEVWRLVLGVLLTVVAVAALGQVYGSFVFGLLEGLGLLMDGETLGQETRPSPSSFCCRATVRSRLQCSGFFGFCTNAQSGRCLDRGGPCARSLSWCCWVWWC